jgi:Ca2+/Na+ antiporter
MLILLITHIIIALAGLVVAATSLFTISEKMIRSSYALTAGTLATGTILVMMTGNVLKSCLSGLLYLSAVLVMTAVTKYRLALKKAD